MDEEIKKVQKTEKVVLKETYTQDLQSHQTDEHNSEDNDTADDE